MAKSINDPSYLLLDDLSNFTFFGYQGSQTARAHASALAEFIQDTVAAFSVAGTGLMKVYNDAGNMLTWSADPEFIRDTIATALQSATGIVVTPNDAADSISIALDSENLQDQIAAFLQAGANVTITYNDGANTLTIAGSGGGGSSAWALPAPASNPASPIAVSGLSGNSVVRITGITGAKAISAPTGTFPAGRNWVLYEITATGGPWPITLGSGITHDGIGIAPTIEVPANGKQAFAIYSDDGTNWRIPGDYDFATNKGMILSALGISTLKARFEITNPTASTINLLRENVHIGSILAVLAWTDVGSLTANVQVADKTGASDWTPTGAASITGLSAVAVTGAPARTAASGANTLARSGTADRILQVVLSALSGSPTRLVLEVEYAL